MLSFFTLRRWERVWFQRICKESRRFGERRRDSAMQPSRSGARNGEIQVSGTGFAQYSEGVVILTQRGLHCEVRIK